jgi:hypothetical protein
MKQGSIISNYESEFFKNEQAKLNLIEHREKQSAQVKANSTNISIDTLQYNASSDLICIWLGVIFLIYLKIFKRKSKIAKVISYLVSFNILSKSTEFIAIKNLMNNPGSKFMTEIITAIPILIIAIYIVRKFKNRRRKIA